MSTPGKPIIGRPSLQEVNHKGKIFKKGVKLWPVGTDVIQGVIYSRLNISQRGAGFIHFPIGLDSEFYEQLTAEKLVTRFHKGFPHREWVKTRDRNEALDCAVYAYAVATALGLARMDWRKLENSIIPKEEAPLIEQPKSKEPEPVVTRKKNWVNRERSGNFVNDW
jgi:phage terminase large subunit GpA-like protein